MSRNRPATPIWTATIDIPGGARELVLTEAEAHRYNADPDGYAASTCGLTKREYLEWVELDGVPLCAHRTSTGDLCRNPVGMSQFDADGWKARHRQELCHIHGGRRNAATGRENSGPRSC